MFSLLGKKALVTGASRGIGRGIALALAAQGADVIINYRGNAQQANAVAEEIKKLGRDSFIIQADVSNSIEVARMFEELKNKWGKLDILVNNAGIIDYASFEDIPEEQWDRILGTNLKGQFLCSQQAVKIMGSPGRIICIASIASGGVGVGFAQLAHYSASKGGVIGMVESMALDLAKRGINVNAIAPGAIESDMTKGALENPETAKSFLSRVPKGRIGQPADIGAATAFLASDEADYITGTVLYVDGGWLAG
ncbi:MAG TPA: 3-oxoacyl-ACP reductase family protein [Patescibacteria group bacterium]|nr:3-oxoacyl-ACP reductase family protein [Patescibacteria group bacterium]